LRQRVVSHVYEHRRMLYRLSFFQKKKTMPDCGMDPQAAVDVFLSSGTSEEASVCWRTVPPPRVVQDLLDRRHSVRTHVY